VPATYSPGGGTLIGHSTRWLLLARPLDPGLVVRLWPRFEDGTAPAALADLAQRLSDGAPCALVDTATGEQIARGLTVAADGDTPILTLGGSTKAPALPVEGGAVGASALRVTAPAVVRRPAAAPVRPLIDGVPAGIRVGGSAPPPPPQPPAPAPAPTTAPAPAATAAPDPVARRDPASRLGPADEPTLPSLTGAADPDIAYGATRVRPATPPTPATARPGPRSGPPAGAPPGAPQAHTVQRPGGAHPLQQHTGETVLAVRCPQQHLTPLESPVCRQCGAPVGRQEPIRVPRPPLGRLLLADGQEVLLDRGAVLGRRPEAVPGGEMWPHLVELPADNTALSRSHLLVELQGWRILARDLGSLGGSVITAPEAPPMRMRPHESYVLDPGSVIDLAGGFAVRCVVELSGDPA